MPPGALLRYDAHMGRQSAAGAGLITASSACVHHRRPILSVGPRSAWAARDVLAFRTVRESEGKSDEPHPRRWAPRRTVFNDSNTMLDL